MSLRTCILGSGSSGNCTFVGSETTRILIDAGLTAKEIERRLAQIDVDPATLQGICISHEHGDHTAGLRVMHTRHGIPVFANRGTSDAMARDASLRSSRSPFLTTHTNLSVSSWPARTSAWAWSRTWAFRPH